MKKLFLILALMSSLSSINFINAASRNYTIQNTLKPYTVVVSSQKLNDDPKEAYVKVLHYKEKLDIPYDNKTYYVYLFLSGKMLCLYMTISNGKMDYGPKEPLPTQINQ